MRPDFKEKIISKQTKETLKVVPLPNLPELPEIPKLPKFPKIRAQNMTPVQNPIEKISTILKDPSVLGLECLGPGKFILVNHSGKIQTTPLAFSKENIDEVMSYISQKTSIPLIQGVFKTVLGNLLVTAVISDFVGTRFIIQKRMPF